MERNLDRRLLFAEKLLDSGTGRGGSSRIAVYRDLRKLWKQAGDGGDHSDKAKLASFFVRRVLFSPAARTSSTRCLPTA